LTDRLIDHYRGQGWPTRTECDGIVLADGPGGVTWIGTAVTDHEHRPSPWCSRSSS